MHPAPRQLPALNLTLLFLSEDYNYTIYFGLIVTLHHWKYIAICTCFSPFDNLACPEPAHVLINCVDKEIGYVLVAKSTFTLVRFSLLKNLEHSGTFYIWLKCVDLQLMGGKKTPKLV